METSTEAVSLVYENGTLVALVKRDQKSRKTLVYTVKEARESDIISLITKEK